MNRYPACKIRVIDLQKGTFVKGDNNNPNHILLPDKKKVFRTHIIGTILRIQQTGNTASIVIDDGSASILLRIFEEFPQMKTVSAGATVSVIGKIRSYKEQVYIVPEIIKECDKAWLGAHKAINVQVEPNPVDKKVVHTSIESIIEYLNNNDSGSGVSMQDLTTQFGNIEQIIDNMLKHGVVYAHMPGRIKLL